tara:strand:- start:660 stop:1004 length:345 start_codon:yes stop_codon:yes gene_type:complete
MTDDKEKKEDNQAVKVKPPVSQEQVEKIESYGLRVIHTNCKPETAQDGTLPTDSQLLTLKKDDTVWYDIVKGFRSNIFDAYYDTMGGVIQKMDFTNGKISAKLWGSVPKKPKRK